MTQQYHGQDRRSPSECPLTVEQAYKILNNLDQSLLAQNKSLQQQEDILRRLDRLEKYIFAGRAVFWVVTTTGVFAAWIFGIWHDIREFLRS